MAANRSPVVLAGAAIGLFIVGPLLIFVIFLIDELSGDFNFMVAVFNVPCVVFILVMIRFQEALGGEDEFKREFRAAATAGAWAVVTWEVFGGVMMAINLFGVRDYGETPNSPLHATFWITGVIHGILGLGLLIPTGHQPLQRTSGERYMVIFQFTAAGVYVAAGLIDVVVLGGMEWNRKFGFSMSVHLAAAVISLIIGFMIPRRTQLPNDDKDRRLPSEEEGPEVRVFKP